MISNSVKKSILVAGIALLINGCQRPTPTTLTPAALQQRAQERCDRQQKPHSQEECLYLYKMHYGIASNFTGAHHYKGRHCDVTVQYDTRGHYSVVAARGDEPMCLKAWEVIGSANNLPPPPAGLPDNIRIDFTPN